MKRFPFILPVLIMILFSCKKQQEQEMIIPIPISAPEAPATASYKMILTGMWKAPAHTVPANDHFTKFNGMIHSGAAAIFRLGTLASTGVENVAEVGNDIALLNEMNNYISSGSASEKFSLSLPTITSTDSVIINVTKQYSSVSFQSMIAPSPDWFAGLDSYNLLQQGQWVTDVTVNITGYDAGTEDGNVFAYNNPATSPQQPVSYLTPLNASVIANGNAVIAPFATVRFIKL